jgi:hypothetical protein
MRNEKEYRKNYHRTKKGLIVNIARTQRKNSMRRKHPSPEYDTDWLYEWLMEKPLFHKLFKAWEEGGYIRLKRPTPFSSIKMLLTRSGN